jgi:small subunit ribosomal protein S15e
MIYPNISIFLSISYKPVKHGRPGIGATHSSRFVPLK